jgi:hypothetical protein
VNEHIQLGTRLQWGFTSIFNKPNGAPDDYPTIKNRVFHFFASYSF